MGPIELRTAKLEVMTRRSILTLLTILALGMGLAIAPATATGPTPPQKNLFAPSAPSATRPEATSPPSVFDRAVGYVQQQQRALYRQFADAVRNVKSEQSFAPVFALMLLSFLYGVFHAAGPGHGKAVISAYLLANERAVKRGVALSFAASFAQGLSAVVLVSTVMFVLKGLGVTTKQSMAAMITISAWMIVAIGVWMLWSSLQRSDAHQHHDHTAGACHHDHHVQPNQLGEPLSWAKAGAIVAAVGLRPCSGAIFVLLFANTIGLYVAGIWSTFVMALGTAITVSALALLTLLSKKAALRLAGGRTRWTELFYRGFAVLGSLAIIGLGVLLLLSASSPQTPFS